MLIGSGLYSASVVQGEAAFPDLLGKPTSGINEYRLWRTYVR